MGYIAQLFAKIGVDTSGVKSGLASAKGDLQKFGAEASTYGSQASSSMSSLTGVISTVGAAFAGVTAAVAVGKQVFDFGIEGAQLQRLEQAGQNLAAGMGESFDNIVAAIRKASLGMVSNADIMLAANRAMMLGVGQSAEQMADLMQVAAFRARAMGITTTQAFNDIVTGIGRMSPMILDNLGIVIDSETRFREYAASIGTTADKLDDATKKQVLLNQVIAEGKKQIDDAGGLALDNAGKVEQMDAAWKNFGDTWKMLIAPVSGDIAAWLTSLIDPTQQVANNLNQMSAWKPPTWEVTTTWGPLQTQQNQKITIPVEYTGYDPLKTMAEQERLNKALETQSKYMWDAYRTTEMTNYTITKMDDGIRAATKETKAWADQMKKIGVDVGKADLGIAKALENDLKQIDFYQAGGMVFQSLRDKILEKLKAGLITPEEAEAALSALWIGAQQLDVELGNLTWSEFQRNIREKFGPGSDVEKALLKLGELLGLDGESLTIDVLLNWVYGLPGSPGGGGGGGGPSTPKPARNYLTTWRPNTQPGAETTDAGQSQWASWNESIYINNYDTGTAALTLAQVLSTRRQRLNNSMPGVA